MSILVTGANGFIGIALCKRLVREGWDVRAAVRSVETIGGVPEGVDPLVVGPLFGEIPWAPLLKGVDTIIHLAAITGAGQPPEQLTTVNVEATDALARGAAQAGVRRLVFLSTAKVNGEKSWPDQPFQAADEPHPQTPYARSKRQAEKALAEIANQTSLKAVVIRAPLVYGAGVKGNFLVLWNWVGQGIPLPLGAVRNQRSLVALDNLVDLIICCISHPAAVGETLLVSDGEDLSTPELLRRIARAQGRSAYLPKFPVSWLNRVAALFHKTDVAQRLLGNFQVDISKTRELLDWEPPLSVDEGLARCCVHAGTLTTLQSQSLRLCDILLSAAGLLIGLPLFILMTLGGLLDTGMPLFRQKRVGRHMEPFDLLKFRTMKPDTASVASHLVDPGSVTRYGRFLRWSKLDELPQLWNVFKGDMSLVGPRPCLPSQQALIRERQSRGVFAVRPGITGLAQINGIDMSMPKKLAETDARMIRNFGLIKYFTYILKTILGRGRGDRLRS